MKLLDSPGFWTEVDRCGGNKTQTTKMKEKKKTKQEQALNRQNLRELNKNLT